jgi:hypothetical protein
VVDPSACFEAARRHFREFLRSTLEVEQPIDGGNVDAVEIALMESEIALVRRVLREVGLTAFQPPPVTFARQVGTTCMSTSLGNGLLTFGEATLLEDTERRVAELADDIVANTSAFGKPGDYRSVDDLFKYLESGRLREIRVGGEAIRGDYRVRLTGSFVDVAEALWTGRARLLVQRSAHARLVFAFDWDEQGEPWLALRDPLRAPGPGHERISLETLRLDFLWSPLKKIPRLFGPTAFSELSAEELLGHLDRYDEMENLGVDCPSALLYRAEEAPPLHTPRPSEESSGDVGGGS